MAACAALYTVFGLFFTHLHANRFSAEMMLFSANHLGVTIHPDDPYLVGLVHQIGSAVFFGLSLGLLAGFACLFSVPLIIHASRLGNRKMHAVILPLYLLLAALLAAATFSGEEPLAGILCSILTPAAFFIPWNMVMRKAVIQAWDARRWLIFFSLLLLPLVYIIGQSYTFIRDSIVDIPILRSINSFYYNHTLLAADVIKPVSYRTQNVIAHSPAIALQGRRPHGSLWISTKNLCDMPGATLRVGTNDDACSNVRWDGALGLSARELFKAPAADRNIAMRRGIGFFFKNHVIVLVPLFFMAWAAFALARLSRRNLALSIACVIVYILLFIPAGRQAYYAYELRNSPELLHAFANAPQPGKRYVALRYLLADSPRTVGMLSPGELTNLSEDPLARIRLNALMLAAKQEDRIRYLSLFKQALADPQLNVRTKACWALGETGTGEALELLRVTLARDSSWYVRDYAYNAIGRIAPESLSVRN